MNKRISTDRLRGARRMSVWKERYIAGDLGPDDDHTVRDSIDIALTLDQIEPWVREVAWPQAAQKDQPPRPWWMQWPF